MNNLFADTNIDWDEVDYIAGGPCICFAKGNPDRLQLQDKEHSHNFIDYYNNIFMGIKIPKVMEIWKEEIT